MIDRKSRFDADVANRLPEANLDCCNGNGDSFNKRGVMSIAAEEGSFIYKLNADGSLSAIKAEYDEYDEVYNFKTRSIDRYVISDVALKNTGAVTKPESGNGNNGGTTGGNGHGNPNTGVAL